MKEELASPSTDLRKQFHVGISASDNIQSPIVSISKHVRSRRPTDESVVALGDAVKFLRVEIAQI